ncbi:hypothetical protein D7Y13_06100 [Corallococcus praedator]|uniref:DksA C4-type domain-containing protein n=1 Tax=Corallococcus praedator TaxID=2316724 RepID=A0ABX9QP96_9BACT|nr:MULTISPECIES: hypothetical protein [Corallococcus]RKH18817.1 hypothetical protein D7X74_08430 [Corallococcus sp. CA047B]RKH33956.1 hypothetical protein D7X75_10210 [Corallococcus sp. CA031C]RKI14295.1 hypothetical protein D7Y13_06100 [Corallococcus praedator]
MDVPQHVVSRELLPRWMRLLALRQQHQHVWVLVQTALSPGLPDPAVAAEAKHLLERLEARELQEFLALEQALERLVPDDASRCEVCGGCLEPVSAKAPRASRCPRGCPARAR